MLSVKNLRISYGGRKIIENLSFDLGEGEILGVYGGNGSGKTSLCLAVGDIQNNADVKGEIILYGKPIKDYDTAAKRSLIGMVFQDPDNHFVSDLALDELAFACENLCFSREEIKKRIDEALKLCSIEHLKHRRIKTLSGGEKQLLALASALTVKPKLLIADEINANIDREGKIKIRQKLKEFAENGGSALLVTHDKEDLKLCHGILEL
ncbi:MAG: energy-coupling factor ABC transporter ATP-binding protein [Christensenellales bacterium]|jgi:energy-coupling factor transport system ATP-binding protein|nr:ABC transporter ATP-binding protein [Clostridiales bacterium]